LVAIRSKTLVGQSSMTVRAVLYALILVTSVAVSFSSFRVFAPVKQCVFICFAALLCFMDRVWLVSQLKALKNNLSDGLLALLALFFIVSLLWTNPLFLALIHSLTILMWFMFYLLIKHQFIYEKDMVWLLNILGISLFVNLLAGVAQVSGMYLPPEISAFDGPVGLIGNSNWFAIYIAMLLMPEAWFLKNRFNLPRTILAGLNIALGLPLLYLTYCRGAWFCFLSIVIMWAIMRHWGNDVGKLKKRISVFLFSGAVLGILLLLLSVYYPSLLLSIWGGKKQQNVECRLMAYNITWQGAKQSLVAGHGFKSFGNDYPKMQAKFFKGFPDEKRGRNWLLARPFRHVHNDVLELVYEGGLISILIALIIAYYVVSKFFFSAQRIPEGHVRQLSHLFFSMATGFIVAAVSSFPFHQTTSAMIFVIVLGGLSYEMGGGRRELPESGFLFTGAALMTTLVVISVALCMYMSESYTGNAYTKLKRGELDDASSLIKIANNMNPYNGKAISLSGQVQSYQKNFDEAEKLFNEAAKYHYDSTCAFNLGILAKSQKDYVKAKGYFIRSLCECPNPRGLVALGDVNRFMVNFLEAEKLYGLALEMDRGYGPASYKLARLYVRQNKNKEAVVFLRDNINVFDRRSKLGMPATASGAVLFLKNLKLLYKTALKTGNEIQADYAQKRLKKLEGGNK